MAKGLDLDKFEKYLKVGVLGVGLLVLVVILLLLFKLILNWEMVTTSLWIFLTK